MHIRRTTRTSTTTTETTTEILSLTSLSKSERTLYDSQPAAWGNPERALIRKIEDYARIHGCSEADATHAILHA